MESADVNPNNEEEPPSSSNIIGLIEVTVKKPKKILHFSDGVMEEYSSDEEDKVDSQKEDPVDESTLTWGPWMLHKMKNGGRTVLGAVDYVGGTLAEFFGISSPKYFYEIQEHNRQMKEEMQYEKEVVGQEMSGWPDSRKVKVNKAYIAEEPSAHNVDKY